MDWNTLDDDALKELVEAGLLEMKRREMSTRNLRNKARFQVQRETKASEMPRRLAIIAALQKRYFFHDETFRLNIWIKKGYPDLRLYLSQGLDNGDEQWRIIYFHTGNPWQGAGEIMLEGDFPKHFMNTIDPDRLRPFFSLVCDNWPNFLHLTTEDLKGKLEPDPNEIALYDEALKWLKYAPGYLKESKK